MVLPLPQRNPIPIISCSAPPLFTLLVREGSPTLNTTRWPTHNAQPWTGETNSSLLDTYSWLRGGGNPTREGPRTCCAWEQSGQTWTLGGRLYKDMRMSHPGSHEGTWLARLNSFTGWQRSEACEIRNMVGWGWYSWGGPFSLGGHIWWKAGNSWWLGLWGPMRLRDVQAARTVES